MKTRIFQLVFVLMVVGALFSVGCGGSGSSGSPAMVDDSPIGKVEQIVSNWRASGGMMLTKTESGELKLVDTGVDQTTFQTGTEEDYHFDDRHGESAEPIGTLVFKDMDGKTWNLEIMSVDYLSNINARVNTRYMSQERITFAGLKIVFIMFKDQGEWFLEDMEVAELPTTEPVFDRYLVSGTTFKHDFIVGDTSQAGVEMLMTNALNAQLVYRSTTNAEGKFSFSVPAGNYNLSVAPSSPYMFASFVEVPTLAVTADYVIGESLELIPRFTRPQAFGLTGSILKEPKLSTDTDESGVVIILYNPSDNSTIQSEPTDASGNFSISKITPGTYQLMTSEGSSYRLPRDVDYIPITIVDQNYHIDEPVIVVPQDYQEPTTLFRVTGVLTKSQLKEGDTTGTPVPFYVYPSNATETTEPSYTGTTQSDGSFDFFLQPGTYLLFVDPQETGYIIMIDSASTEEPEIWVLFELSADVNLGNIAMMPVDLTEVYAIAGFLTEEITNDPIEGALIQVTYQQPTEDEFIANTVSAFNGYYFVPVPGLGNYTMTISREGYETQTLDVVVDGVLTPVSEPMMSGRR